MRILRKLVLPATSKWLFEGPNETSTQTGDGRFLFLLITLGFGVLRADVDGVHSVVSCATRTQGASAGVHITVRTRKLISRKKPTGQRRILRFWLCRPVTYKLNARTDRIQQFSTMISTVKVKRPVIKSISSYRSGASARDQKRNRKACKWKTESTQVGDVGRLEKTDLPATSPDARHMISWACKPESYRSPLARCSRRDRPVSGIIVPGTFP